MKHFQSYILDEQYLYERVQGQQMQDAALRSFFALKKHFTSAVTEGFTRLWKFYDSENKGGRDIFAYAQGENPTQKAQNLFLSNSGISHLNSPNGPIFIFHNKIIKDLAIIPSFIDKSNMEKSVGGSFLMVKLHNKIDSAGGTFCAVRHGCQDATINISLDGSGNPLDIRQLGSMAFRIITSGGRNKASALIKNYSLSIAVMFDAYKSVYIHEYTHYLDEIRYKGKPSKTITQSAVTFWDKSKQDKTAYYTAENEVNARLSQVEGVARSGLNDLLVASISDATAYEALALLRKQNPRITTEDVEKVFNDPKLMKNKLVANRAEVIVRRKLDQLKTEPLPIWMGPFASMKDKDPFLGLIAHISHRNLGAMVWDAWNKNDKIAKKALSRFYGVSKELRKQMDDFIAGVEKGKVPSSTDWTKSIERCRYSYDSILYSGHFMNSKSKMVYSPKETYKTIDYDWDVS